ncbi:uncharacterized protein LOC112491635 [Ziziphus jujuba]|uniref:Uncharacterized protein LOC112491635 n=1 Tax=Ziziphus jujuba TaxID=326968 RepID=A0ABM3IJE1_ZIZJJ|nr:uncharacterized protein LOC112491635 [Ziziphus jujuba]
MELPIPNKLEKLWDLWDIRLSVLLSLLLQVFLVLFAPFRQRSRNCFLLMLIWSAYLIADWIAAVTIGLITKSQNDSRVKPKQNEDVLAFWASFLLLHLGGPDSITSFALEDNEFWLRHLFGLLLQVLGAGYSFFLTLPKNQLWIPTILVFVVGTIKYAERTFALYLASLDCFGSTTLPKPYPGPDYEEAVAIYSTTRSVEVPEQTEVTMAPNLGNYRDRKFAIHLQPNLESDQVELMGLAHSLFENFKGLIVGFLLSSKYRESSRDFFLQTKPEVSFRLIEYELSFMYQALHTKMDVVQTKAGRVFRLISLFFLVVAFMSFQFLVDKDKFKKFELILTYCLLTGAIVLDIFSGIKLIFSDLVLIAHKNWKKYIPDCFLQRRRWSNSVSLYNMIAYCVDWRWLWKSKYLFPDFIRSMLDKLKMMKFSSSDKIIEDLTSFIFEELKNKSSNAKTLSEAMEKCSQRGDGALFGTSSYIKLKWSISEFQYGESLLLWHLATELCYQATEKKSNPEKDDQKKESRSSRTICKILSDYMFYLLVMKPAMLAPVLGNWQIVFQDTFEEAERYLGKYSISSHAEACKRLINVKTKFRPAAVKGIRSKSVLFDACILAQQLQHLEEELEENQWVLMSKVWVELMCYGAINCRPIVHAQQPSKGGELLTFTWLLMNHLGLGLQFNEQDMHAGTRLVAVK